MIFLDNIEILFDADLQQDPLHLLKSLFRNVPIVVSWSGTFEKGKLIYVESGHIGYIRYDLWVILVVDVNGGFKCAFMFLMM